MFPPCPHHINKPCCENHDGSRTEPPAHRHICIYIAPSYLKAYRGRCKGPPLSLLPQLDLVRRIAFWLGLVGRPAFGSCLPCPHGSVVFALCMQRWSMFALVSFQTCLLSHTADISAVGHGRRVGCVTQQTCLLCHRADMSAASHSRHVCCDTVPVKK